MLLLPALLCTLLSLLCLCFPPKQRMVLWLGISLAWWYTMSPSGLVWLLAVHSVVYFASHRLNTSSSQSSVTAWLACTLAPLLWTKFGTALTDTTSFVIPLGMSYYTFQCVGYLLQLHWGTSPVLTPLELLLYGSFFPKAAVGPVERPSHFLTQLQSAASSTWHHPRIRHAVLLILCGLFMKWVLANRLAVLIDTVYAAPDQAGTLATSLVILAYPWQLYFDFGGYSFMALGLAKLLGFSLTANFDRPFFATTISQFWSRWHISLSSWFQDHVYTPIRFKLRRKRSWGVIVATVSSFMLVGLWHGAGGVFILFGLLHGCAVAFEALVGIKPADGKSSLLHALHLLYPFVFLALTLVLFRSSDLSHAATLLSRMSHFQLGSDFTLILKAWNKVDLLLLLLFIPVFEVMTAKGLLSPVLGESVLSQCATPVRWLSYSMLLASIALFGVFNHSPFIYERF